jgi:HK97 family phage portal protein
MSFLGRMFSRGNPGALVSSQKADETRAYIYSITENARISAPNIESMYAEFCRALDASSIVSNAHDKITSAVSSMKFVITRNGDPIENHPLMALLNRPNPEMSRSLFLASIASSRFLAGTAYIQRTLNRARKPIELWPIRPDKMELKLDDKGHPRAYVMGNPKTEDNVGSISGVHFPIDPVTGQSDIASIRSVNPLNLFFGRSPISGAWNDIQIFVETLQFNYGILRNGGFPSGALVYKGEGELVATQLETFRSMIKTHVKGSENAGTPLVLAKGFEWVQMGLSPDDLSLTLLVEQSSRAISHALGVPALLLGLPGDNTVWDSDCR